MDNSDFKKGVNDVSSGLQSLAGKVKGLAIGAMIAKSFKLAVDACKECVEAFKESEIAVTKFSTIAQTLGFSSQQIQSFKDFAGEVQNLTGMSDEAVLSAEQLLLATNALDEEGIKKATISCANLAVAMGTDITSSASALAIALQSPSDGLTRLRRSGILFTDEEENLVKALDEAGEKAKAQEVILAKIESRYKGVAEAVGNTDVGTLSKISETWGDIKENLGSSILSAIQPALDALLKTLTKVKEFTDHYRTIREERENREAMIDEAVNGSGEFASWSTDQLVEELAYQKQRWEMILAEYLFNNDDGHFLEKDFKQYETAWLEYGGKLAEEIKTRLEPLPEVVDDVMQTAIDALEATKPTGSTGTPPTEVEKSSFMQEYDYLNSAKENAKAELEEFKKAYSEMEQPSEMMKKQLIYLEERAEATKTAFDEWMDSIGKEAPPILNEYQQSLADLETELATYQGYYDKASTEAERNYWQDKIDMINEATEALMNYGQAVDDNGSDEPEYKTGSIVSTIEAIVAIKQAMAEALANNPDADISSLAENLQTVISEGLIPVVNQLGGAFSELGYALATGGDAFKGFAKSAINSLASIVESYGYEMLAEGTAKLFSTLTRAEGIAEVAKSAGILALGGVVRGLGSKFENGGIVGGSGYTGDKHMIFANAGELILNRAQQRNLASQFGGGGNSISVAFNGTVLGDQQSISSWVYDGIERAKNNGVI